MFPNTLRANPQLPDGLCALQDVLLHIAKISTSCRNGLGKDSLIRGDCHRVYIKKSRINSTFDLHQFITFQILNYAYASLSFGSGISLPNALAVSIHSLIITTAFVRASL